MNKLVDKDKITLFWFRRDLRLNDNVGLYTAIKNSDCVLPIFIFDTNILEKLPSMEDKRVCFIYNSLSILQKEIVKFGIKKKNVRKWLW